MIEKKRIVNIKNILRIILLIITIFATIKSCSYALTIDDVEDYLEYYKFETDNGSTEWGSNTAIVRLYDLYINQYARFQSLFDYAENMENITYKGDANATNGNKYYTLCNRGTRQVNSNSSGDAISCNTGNWAQIQYTGSSQNWGSVRTGSTNNINTSSDFVILFGSHYFGDNLKQNIKNNTIVSQKQWTFTVERSNNEIRTNGANQVTAFDIRIGQDWDINNVSLLIWVYDNNNNKVYKNNIVYSLTHATGSNQYIVNFETENLDNDNTYYIDLRYENVTWREGDRGQRIIKTEATNPSGDTPTPSGEVPSGDNGGNTSVDLTTTNQKLDNIQQAIISGDNNIINEIKQNESGEIARDNFWKETYNNLFTMSSGDIDDLKRHIEDNMEDVLSYTDYSEELGILENLENTEPTDFVIRWEAVEYKDRVLIESGEINFNSIVEEWELTEVHELIQVITTFALIVLMYNHFRRTLFIAIGIGTEIYDQAMEEQGIVESQHETWNYNTGEATITTTKKQGNKSVSVVAKSELRKRIE